MSKVLMISQSQDAAFTNLINSSLNSIGKSLTLLTGSNQISEMDSTIEIIEMPHYKNNTAVERFKSWFSFASRCKKWLKSHDLSEYDFVFFTSNPPVNQNVVRYAQRSKCKTIYLVWDIYPEVIERTYGKLVKPISYAWRRVNRGIYKRCYRVITIGECMKKTLEKTISNKKIEIIPYFADDKKIVPIKKEKNQFAIENDLTGKIVFMYSGKIGLGHGFSEILGAAKKLQKHEDIIFLIIGNGPGKSYIEERVKNEEIKNVRVLPYQPIEILPLSLAAADVSLITLKKNLGGTFLPSKIYDAMASGSAIISISDGDNDIIEMVNRHGIGINVSIADEDMLIKAVERFREDEHMLVNCQKKSRMLAEKYGYENVKKSYVELFKSL